MRYDIEFGKWVREHPTDVSAIGINALLDEIDRLNARVSELEAMTSTDGFTRYLVNQLKDNPELQQEYAKTMSDTSEYTEVIHNQARRINELTAEADKHRWISVEERLPADYAKVLFYDSCCAGVVYGCHIKSVPQWATDSGTYYHSNNGNYDDITHWYEPEPPKEE